MKYIPVLLILLLVSLDSFSQITMPAPSPAVELKQKIGLTDVSLVYSRPSIRGRAIFGELVPFGEVWRTGANASTKITFADEVTFGGQKVAAGTYALYSIPGQNEWTIILSENTELWGSMGYTPDQDLIRIPATPQSTSPTVETFTLDFSTIDMDLAHLRMMWENTLIEVPIQAEVHSKVLAQIESNVKNNPNAPPGVLYQAANYYYERRVDLDNALNWVSKALESQQQYWVMHLKAKIEAELGKKAEAIASAEASMKLAEEANNPDYVRLNQKLIAELK